MEKSASDGEATAVPLPDSWNFEPNERLLGLMSISVRGVLATIKAEMVASGGGGGGRPVIPMGHGDPSAFPCFRTAPEAVDAVAGALQSGEYNSYSTCVGLEPARR
jgi:tyrosine aminotransferase